VNRAGSCDLPVAEKSPRSMTAIDDVVAVGIALSIFADALSGARLRISQCPCDSLSMTHVLGVGLA
jgi:hypothetical protein